MPFFVKSSTLAQCDQCSMRFDPVYGGVCPSCGRLLCARHLYGEGARRFLKYFGVRTVCAQCRASA